MVKCTTAWDGVGYGGEDEIECTPANVLMLYTELPWLRDQVSAFIDDRTNFLGEA
jgi:hypothetical protein